MPRDIPPKNDFPNGFHVELARIVIEFGRLEYLLKLCVKDMSEKKFDEGLLEAESQGQFVRLCEHALDLAETKLSDAERSAFENIVSIAKQLAVYRNDSVHAYWTMENGAILRVRPRKDGDGIEWDRSRAVTVAELAAKADEMKQLHVDLERRRMQWREGVALPRHRRING